MHAQGRRLGGGYPGAIGVAPVGADAVPAVGAVFGGVRTGGRLVDVGVGGGRRRGNGGAGRDAAHP